MRDKPTRCIDPVMKFCQECRWGWVHYPKNLADRTFKSGCTLGYDQGRPEDEPTEEELKEFERWCNHDRA